MKVNILLFHDFETLDVFGSVEILGKIEEYELNYVSLGGGLIVSAQGASIMTKKIEPSSSDDILVVPGGRGTRALVNDSVFLEMLIVAVKHSNYCLSICTGSALLAKAGLLNGKCATSNKQAFSWVKSTNTNVKWIQNARWVVDGKYYTSSGVSAGMDMTLGFIRDRFDEQKALHIAKSIEYIWNSDNSKDPFANYE
ncbi:MAG: ThiJ/PfpI protein [Herbinix sp.]|jgi:transcriptional regulator GlxA family with amidase domain|nr:ThiJ/PfpI protein [Herbinix sp.]